MKLLDSYDCTNVRQGRVAYGQTERRVLKRRATCRCCGQLMPKGTEVIDFMWDFHGSGSWTAVACVMHFECEPVKH